MLYFETRIDQGASQVGQSYGNQYIVGIRWNFQVCRIMDSANDQSYVIYCLFLG